MTKTETTAYRLGRTAFLSGRDRVVVLDEHLTNVMMAEDRTVRIRMMRAWYRGWDTANLEGLV